MKYWYIQHFFFHNCWIFLINCDVWLSMVSNCVRTKFEAIIVNLCVLFNAKFLLDSFRFCSRTLSDFLNEFLHFSSLSDLRCSRSEIKLVARSDCDQKEIKAILAEWLRCWTANLDTCQLVSTYTDACFLPEVANSLANSCAFISSSWFSCRIENS